jgi:hypothetical protein
MKNLFVFLCVVALITFACKSPTDKQVETPTSATSTVAKVAEAATNAAANVQAEAAKKLCTVQPGEIMGVKLGDPMDEVKKTYSVKLPQKTGEGTFDSYVKSKEGPNDVVIYPIKKNGKEVVHMVEYTGACIAGMDVKVGSTVADLRKAYPDLKAHGSEIEGRTIAMGGGFTFLLDTYEAAYELDQKKLKPDVKIKAIVIQ